MKTIRRVQIEASVSLCIDIVAETDAEAIAEARRLFSITDLCDGIDIDGSKWEDCRWSENPEAPYEARLYLDETKIPTDEASIVEEYDLKPKETDELPAR